MSLHAPFRTDHSIKTTQSTVPSASSSADMYSSKGNLNVSSAGTWGAASLKHPRASSLRRWWLISLSAIAAFLMISICHQNSGRNILEGIQLRRLGEGESEEDDDLSGPPSPSFAELCYELGNWTPQVPLPGELRASPVLVEGILESIEAEGESGEGGASSSSPSSTSHGLETSVSGTASRAILREQDLHKEETPGPSWKVETVIRSSSDQARSSSRLVASQPPASLSSGPVSQKEASTSSGATWSGAASMTGSNPSRKHPFVRLPTLKPGVQPPQFVPLLVEMTAGSLRSHCSSLREIRRLFLKEELNLEEARQLVSHAEDVARHAYAYMTNDLIHVSPAKAAEALSRRFMVWWTLLSASQVLGADWQNQSWWKELALKVPTRFFARHDWVPRGLDFNYRLIEDLSEALEKLKSGRPLPDELVIDLKRRIFCSPHSPSHLKIPSWDPWRDDDRTSSE